MPRAYELWNASDLEAAKRMYAPDAVMSTPPDWPDSITSSGRDEMFKRLVENSIPDARHARLW